MATHADEKEGAIYISSQYLDKALGMVNNQYIEMKKIDRKEELRASLRKELEDKNKDKVLFYVEDKTLNFYIKNFYDRCRSKFSDDCKLLLRIFR